MLVVKRPAVYVAGALVAGYAFLLAVQPAASGPLTEGEKLAACVERVAQLELEVRSLRNALHDSASRECRPPTLASESKQTKQLRCFDSPPSPCSPPYEIDEQGNKNYKPQCLDSSPSPCSPPFEIDEQGNKNYKPQCLDAPLSPCSPPYRYDGDGLKVYKDECL
jgi:hypothetical protein